MGLFTKTALQVLPKSFIFKLIAAGLAFISIFFFFGSFITIGGHTFVNGFEMAFGTKYTKNYFVIVVALIFAIGTFGTLIGLTVYRLKHLLKANKTVLLVGTIIACAIALCASIICFTANTHVRLGDLGIGAILAGILLLGSAGCLGASLFLTIKK